MPSDGFNFRELLDRQREIQRVFLNGYTPYELPDDRKMAFMMETGFALVHEIVEATAETGWKPWASSNHINSGAYRGELADVFIFLMNAMLIDGMTIEDLWRLVEAKQQVNLDRQRDGYDGVSTKCPGCKRAYDDDAVVCRPSTVATGGAPAWCAGATSFFDANGRAIPVRKALAIVKDHPDPDGLCPSCHRAYDDKGVGCCPRNIISSKYAWCSDTQEYIDEDGNPILVTDRSPS